MPSSKYQRTEVTDGKTSDVFHFACVSCDEEGILKLDRADGMKPFSCPGGCGARYVPWTPPGGEPALRCVVRPMRADEESLVDDEDDIDYGFDTDPGYRDDGEL